MKLWLIAVAVMALAVQPARAQDVIIDWNTQTNLAIQAERTDPFNAARALALESLAVLDTVKAIAGERGFLVHKAAPGGLDAHAAAASAGRTMLLHLFPSRRQALDAALAVSLAGRPAGAARDAAVAFGASVADAVQALRADDGSQIEAGWHHGTQPGQWQPTPPERLPPLHPQWATVKPFAMARPDQFRPLGPPALGTKIYRDAVTSVARLGATNSTARTKEQTEIARYWSDAIGTYAPAGHWNAIASSVMAPRKLGLIAEAELFAELNVAMADACIAMADAKYTYWYWRPITAIRAGSDGVAEIPDWWPLLETPNHPSYISGHSSFSGAAALVLTKWLGGDPFSFGSASLPGVMRHFPSFTAAAEEAAMSRVYGGIHFAFENADGLATGRKVGAWTLGAFKGVALRQPGD